MAAKPISGSQVGEVLQADWKAAESVSEQPVSWLPDLDSGAEETSLVAVWKKNNLPPTFFSLIFYGSSG